MTSGLSPNYARSIEELWSSATQHRTEIDEVDVSRISSNAFNPVAFALGHFRLVALCRRTVAGHLVDGAGNLDHRFAVLHLPGRDNRDQGSRAGPCPYIVAEFVRTTSRWVRGLLRGTVRGRWSDFS